MPKIRKVILLITPSREFTRGLLRGIAKYSRIQGLWAFYRPLDYREPKGKERLLPLMKTWDPDGILMREPHKIEEIIAIFILTKMLNSIIIELHQFVIFSIAIGVVVL